MNTLKLISVKALMRSAKSIFIALPLALGCFLTAPATAASINWTLEEVVFNDGGSAFGTFVTDSTSGGLLSYDITTTEGNKLGGFHYDGIGDQFLAMNMFNANPNSFILISTDPFMVPYLNLSFLSGFTSAGTNFIDTSGQFGGSWECNNCRDIRLITAGYATSVSAVPEPETYALLLSGLGLMGFVARRRSQARV